MRLRQCHAWVFDFELGLVGFFGFCRIFPNWIFFFKKNEEVVSSVHLLTYLIKFGEGAPQYFFDFELGLIGFFGFLPYWKNPTKSY
jgi:hypothetical protein